MEIAVLASGSLWIISALLGKRLDSGWGILLPSLALPLFAWWHPAFSEWRLIMAVALVLTVIMLFHQRLRHYILLPSSLVITGGLAAFSLNFQIL